MLETLPPILLPLPEPLPHHPNDRAGLALPYWSDVCVNEPLIVVLTKI